MRMKAARWAAAAAVLTLTLALAATEGTSASREDDPREAVQKIADLIAKGKADEAEKQAANLAKESELADVMSTMSLRRNEKSKAFGVGDKIGEFKPDGIEAKIIALGRKALTPKDASKEADALAQMAYRVAAIADVAKAKTPEKDEGQEKTKKNWLTWTEEMRKSAEELAKAAKQSNPKEIRAAASKLNSSCNNCHGAFRE